MLKSILMKIKYILHTPEKQFVNQNVKFRIIHDNNYKHTFFGYYDRSPWSPNETKILYCATDCDDYTNCKAQIGIYDLKSNEYNILTDTLSWNFQQASQQQWLHDDYIIYNSNDDNSNGTSQVININTQKTETIFPFQIGMIHQEKGIATSYNFARLFDKEIDYGYSNLIDRNKEIKVPHDDGLCVYDLKNGKQIVFLSFNDILDNYPNKNEFNNHFLWIQHPKFSPNGNSILFVLRGRKDNSSKRRGSIRSDLFVYNLNKDTLEAAFLWEAWRKGAHHPVWFDDENILINSYNDSYKSLKLTKFSNFHERHNVVANSSKGMGHPSHKNGWLILDDYPNIYRLQTLKLINIKNNNEFILAKLFSPKKYKEHLGCDLHPRFNSNANIVCFDSTFDGFRKIYLVDIKEIKERL